jgi:general secretion pathway protein A
MAVYNQSFGLRKNPFNMTPDPECLFLTAQHREALVGLNYAILERKGFVVLTGDAGTGKTTLLARVLQFLPTRGVRSSVILNPTLTPSEFLELTLLDFGLGEVPSSKAQRLRKLQNLLLDNRSLGRVSVLIIDEAHKLSQEVLEEVRLLGNFEEPAGKLLQIIMVGQNELDELLNREDLRQLKQRIAVRLSIAPLTPFDVAPYIRHRWLCAGGDKLPFSPESIRYIADASNGIPRVINSLCDNALALALSEGLTTIDARHVRGAAADLQLNVLPPLAMSCETNGVGPRELRTDVGSTHADYGFESIPTI